AVASLAIRHVLVDHARRKKREKRAIKGERVPLDSILEAYEREAGDIEALNEALCRLQAQDEELAEIVQLRFVGRVDWEDIARVMRVSVRTVHRKWGLARAWLREELT